MRSSRRRSRREKAPTVTASSGRSATRCVTNTSSGHTGTTTTRCFARRSSGCWRSPVRNTPSVGGPFGKASRWWCGRGIRTTGVLRPRSMTRPRRTSRRSTGRVSDATARTKSARKTGDSPLQLAISQMPTLTRRSRSSPHTSFLTRMGSS